MSEQIYSKEFAIQKANDLWKKLNNSDTFQIPNGVDAKYVSASDEMGKQLTSLKKDAEKVIASIETKYKRLPDGKILPEKVPVWNEQQLKTFIAEATAIVEKRDQIISDLGVFKPVSKTEVTNVPTSEMTKEDAIKYYETRLENRDKHVFYEKLETKPEILQGELVSTQYAELVKQKEILEAQLNDTYGKLKALGPIKEKKFNDILKDSEGLFSVKNGRILVDLGPHNITKPAWRTSISELSKWIPTLRSACNSFIKGLMVLMLVVFIDSWRSGLKAAEEENPAKPNETPQQKIKREGQIEEAKNKINKANTLMLLEAVVDVFATKAMLELGASGMIDNPVDVSKSQLDAFIRDLLNKNINADEAMGVIQKMFYFFQ